MITIIFITHATSIDNERQRASGQCDVPLSEKGEQQAREVGKRYELEVLDAVFCSDLQRSSLTAHLAFANRTLPIVQDPRLREYDYGDFTQRPMAEVKAEEVNRLVEPFPHGESCQMAAQRIKSFLQDLLEQYEGKKVLVIGHRATQHGLEYWIRGKPLEESISTPFVWQPGWTYFLERL
jgi:broad specificity phosphatase PhoE